MAKFPSTLLPRDGSKEEMDKAILDLLDKINSLSDSSSSASSSIPAGLISPYGGDTAPSGWIVCDGSAVSRAVYRTLFNAIGETWGAGDGFSTFNLPNQAEASFVGIGTRSSGVTAHDVFTLAQFKDDQFQGHWHETRLADNTQVDFQTDNAASGAGRKAAGAGTTINVRAATSDGTNGTPRTGAVTRGKRLGVNYIIKT